MLWLGLTDTGPSVLEPSHKGVFQTMDSQRELCCDIHSALCNALGYLELCLNEDAPSDKLRQILGKVEQQAKRALEAEMRLFKAIGADTFPPPSDRKPS